MQISNKQYNKLPNELKQYFYKGNFHCTTKPLDLMSYLVVLGCKKGELVLDPFVGSGTTCIAAELMNRNSIGIELSKEYFDIARARVKQYKEQQKLGCFL